MDIKVRLSLSLNNVCSSASPRFQSDICSRIIDRSGKRRLRLTY